MPALITPLDGRLTSQNVLEVVTSGDLMWIVSPGNAQEGNTYAVDVDTLAAYVSGFLSLSVVVTSGATSLSPYVVTALVTRVLVNKTVAAASVIELPLAGDMAYGQPVLIKDLKGDADVNSITIQFTGGELCDGLATFTISTPYGWVAVTPVPGGGAWYQSQ